MGRKGLHSSNQELLGKNLPNVKDNETFADELNGFHLTFDTHALLDECDKIAPTSTYPK